MGTRADFYVGRGENAEWLGSIAWDGHPDTLAAEGILTPKDEAGWRAHVDSYLKGRRDGTLPEMGWPWPWNDSGLTDYSYAWDDGKVWCAGAGGWFPLNAENPYGHDPELPREREVWPDMSARKSVTFGSRSGVMLVGGGGVVDPEAIDAQEAAQ